MDSTRSTSGYKIMHWATPSESLKEFLLCHVEAPALHVIIAIISQKYFKMISRGCYFTK